jgi:hypothetical protein
MKSIHCSSLQFIWILVLGFFPSINVAQNIMWQKNLGGTNEDGNFAVQITLDGGYILTGFTSSNDGDVSGNHGGSDIWVAKLNAFQAIEWQKCLGGSNFEIAFSIQPTPDSGYILTGQVNSNDGDVSGNHGGGDVWVVKLNAIGEIEWQKCLGGSAYDAAKKIQNTPDGGYILVGITGSNDGDVIGNHGGTDVWVVKLSEIGNLEWQKCLGGSGAEDAYSIAPTSDGRYILIGKTASYDGDLTNNPPHSFNTTDVWVVKLDAQGAINWQSCIGGDDDEIGCAIEPTSDGGYILAGQTKSNNGDVSGYNGAGDIWLVKLTSLGVLDWQKCIGGANSTDIAKDIHQTLEGGYILTGWGGDEGNIINGFEAIVVKLSQTGAIEWQKYLGGIDDETSYSIKVTSDGGYVVGVTAVSKDGIPNVSVGYGGASEISLIKLDNNGLDISHNTVVKNVSVFPNPILEDKFCFSYYVAKPTTIEIVVSDVLGNTLLSETEKFASKGEYTKTLTCANFPKGIYFLEVKTQNEVISTKILKL